MYSILINTNNFLKRTFKNCTHVFNILTWCFRSFQEFLNKSLHQVNICMSRIYDEKFWKSKMFQAYLSKMLRFSFIPSLYTVLKNSLIIHEENTKKNHKRVVYVIQIHVDLHKI